MWFGFPFSEEFGLKKYEKVILAASIATLVALPFIRAWSEKATRDFYQAVDDGAKRIEEGMAESDRLMGEVMDAAKNTHR